MLSHRILSIVYLHMELRAFTRRLSCIYTEMIVYLHGSRHLKVCLAILNRFGPSRKPRNTVSNLNITYITLATLWITIISSGYQKRSVFDFHLNRKKTRSRYPDR